LTTDSTSKIKSAPDYPDPNSNDPPATIVRPRLGLLVLPFEPLLDNGLNCITGIIFIKPYHEGFGRAQQQ
jgi:hypothetical protein